MKLELFLAADYANTTGDGKLNIMGIFNEISAHNFPAKHSSLQLILILAPETSEHGAVRELIVKLLDADGNQILELSGQISAPEPTGGKTSKLNVIFELKDIVFPRPGVYQFVVLVDEDSMGNLPIRVNLQTPD